MLQVLHLDVSKVDQELHMRCAWEVGGGAICPRAGDVWVARASRGHAKCRRGRVMSGQRGPQRGRTKWWRGNGLQLWASVRVLAVPFKHTSNLLVAGTLLDPSSYAIVPS
jgi:hypothetical protein